MARKSVTKKILIVLDGLVKETASIIYPYKGLGKHFRKFEGSFSQALYKIKQRGYIETVENAGKKYLKITQKGRLKLIGTDKLIKWDGFWRIIAFDIPEEFKKTRDVFRHKLSELNCKPIQKSVLISPSDISDQLDNLIELLNIDNYVEYFICKVSTNEDKFLELFGLEKQ